MPDIEEYVDYRKYLQDFHEEARKRFPFYSYRYFAGKAGINSPGFFKAVADGKRNLTEKTIPSFIKGLGLNPRQGDYFRELVHFTQASSAKEKQERLERMRGLLPRVSEKILPPNYYAYYSQWYNIAVRELACILNWQDNYRLLARSVQPPISAAQAREAVKLLLDLRLIRKRSDGCYEQTSRYLTTGAEVAEIAIREVNTQFSRLGAEAIERIPANRRDISSLAVGLAPETYPLVKVAIQEFKDKVKRLISIQGTPDTVYNLNVEFFPLSSHQDNEDGNESI